MRIYMNIIDWTSINRNSRTKCTIHQQGNTEWNDSHLQWYNEKEDNAVNSWSRFLFCHSWWSHRFSQQWTAFDQHSVPWEWHPKGKVYWFSCMPRKYLSGRHCKCNPWVTHWMAVQSTTATRSRISSSWCYGGQVQRSSCYSGCTLHKGNLHPVCCSQAEPFYSEVL